MFKESVTNRARGILTHEKQLDHPSVCYAHSAHRLKKFNSTRLKVIVGLGNDVIITRMLTTHQNTTQQ